MLVDNIKEDILSSEQFDYLKYLSTPYTPPTSKISISKIGIKIPSIAQVQPLTTQVQSPFSQATPKMVAQPPNIMDAIVAVRYSPLVLPQPLSSLHGGDYQKYLPRFNGQGEVTTE